METLTWIMCVPEFTLQLRTDRRLLTLTPSLELCAKITKFNYFTISATQIKQAASHSMHTYNELHSVLKLG